MKSGGLDHPTSVRVVPVRFNMTTRTWYPSIFTQAYSRLPVSKGVLDRGVVGLARFIVCTVTPFRTPTCPFYKFQRYLHTVEETTARLLGQACAPNETGP